LFSKLHEFAQIASTGQTINPAIKTVIRKLEMAGLAAYTAR
jgi:hypothetical protein